MEMYNTESPQRTVLPNIQPTQNNVDNFDDSMSKILTEVPGFIYLKNANDMTYITCSNNLLELFSFSNSHQINGKSTQNIAKLIKNEVLSKFICDLEIIEKKSIAENIRHKNILTDPFLDCRGHVIQLSITISPIISVKDNTQYILFHGSNIATSKNHEELRKIYESIYSNKKLGLFKFFEHIGFSSYLEKSKSITKRELDVLIMLSKGKTAKEIANLLNISSRTVETHLEKIKQKINARNKIEVMRMFMAYYKH
jgi:DNA-binding CsgD family transcriptional regulator